MKTLNKLFATDAIVFLLMLMAPHKSMAQDDGYVSDQEFYDELQQYGTWVQDDQYGDVWVPDVDGDFRPYATNGYWMQTDYGTTWVSDYPWGWATFHYGRWRYDDYYGWEWIPGHEWAPAWVSWRQGGGYYGWAPMGPGISITLSLGGIGLNINNDYWVYAPQRYITSRYVSRYYAPRTQVSIIIRKTTYIRNTYIRNNRTYITGPRPADIQKITRRRVNVYKINDAPKPGGVRIGVNVINIYRPAIRKTPDARPVRVVSATAYKNEHPTEGIGKRGAVGYNHGNAGKLASVARSDNPNSKVVKVNPKKDRLNKPNEPATDNKPVVTGGHRPDESKTNPAGPQGNTPEQGGAKDNRGHHKTPPATTQPEQGAAQQPAVNNPARPQGNTPEQGGAKGNRGHHKTPPATSQPEPGAAQQPAVNKPAELQGNAPAQPEPANKPERHQHKAPAVIPPAQNNTDQERKEAQQQQQAKDLALQQKQQAAELKRQQEQQAKEQQQQRAEQAKAAQQQRLEAQQQRAQQQQQAQQAKEAAQQQRQQEQQQRKQQQQEQQAARQQAQQQKLQQQQAQQAARQQAQQQKLQQQQQAREARQQAEQQKKQQEEQQKQKPPRN